MKIFKDSVTNKARPEGCIAERYLREETLMYCAGYKGGGGLLDKLDKMADNEPQLLPDFSDSVEENPTTNEGGPLGPSATYRLEGVEYEQARQWVLKSHPSYESWHM